ncbi:MAG: porin [Oligoflexia bacterium]|nr:porin [Oligoflexia bacterium]MBF0364735.1 porin [Oligoflexia bacterium]
MQRNLLLSLVLASLCGSTTAAFAVDAPIVYGLVKKEIKYINQDSAADRREFYGPTDVDGLEGRLGVKGVIPLGSDFKGVYNLELGLNSSLDNAPAADAASDERIRIRQANGVVGADKCGFFTFGQAYLPGMARMGAYDPLLGTGVQMLGLDFRYIAGFVAGYPSLTRSPFMNLISYATPAWNGLKLTLSFDNNDQTSAARTTTAERWWTTELAYDVEFSGMKLSFTGVYGDQSKDGTKAKDEMSYFQTGAKLSVDRFAVGLGYYWLEYNNPLNAKNVDDKSYMAVVSYRVIDPLLLAANYYMTKFDKQGVNTGEQSQFGLGAILGLSENVSTHLAFALVERESNTALGTSLLPKDTTGAKKDNSATLVLAGVTFKF